MQRKRTQQENNVYTIPTTQIHADPSKPTTTNMKEKNGKISKRMHKQQVVAIEYSRNREHEPFASIVLGYKRAR